MKKCHKCHIEIPDDSEFCQYCGSPVEVADYCKTESNNLKVTKKSPQRGVQIALIIFNLLFIGLFVYQTVANKNLSNEIETLTDEVDRLRSNNYEMLNYKENYGNILSTVMRKNIGYASDNFNCNTGVVYLNVLDVTEKVRLTAYWPNGGTVKTNVIGELIVDVDIDKDSWTTSTPVTIKRQSAGVAIIEFSNSVDDDTFCLIVIST